MAAAIEDLEDSTFDPYLADDLMFGDLEDPYTPLAQLRAVAPVVEGDITASIGLPIELAQGYDHEFTVVSYAAAEQILTDPVTFSNRPLAELLANYGPLLSGMDPPDHTRYRRIFQHAFGPAALQAWTQQIVTPVVDELARRLRQAGRAELVEDFARPYPFQVVYQMLELPPDDIEVFYRLTMAQIVTANAAEASEKLGRYFSRLLAARRGARTHKQDLVGVIASIEVDGEPLPDEVAISFLLQLMSAAGETTFRTTTVLLTGLLTNPNQLDAVRNDRTLVPQAIEEALRWDGPVVMSSRSTTTDTVIDGVPVPANSLLNVAFGAANRDPAVFADPDRFDIYRERHRHFAFAFGAHNCLGQQLARLEMHAALNALLDALPHLRLDPDRPEPRLRGAAMRTPRELHVLFGS
jgi:cytochrome P450